MFMRIFVSSLAAFMFVLGSANAADDVAHKLVRVAATNDEWTNTGIKTAQGDIIVVLTRGNQEIRVGSFLGYVDANGSSNHGEGALNIKTGTSASMKIGARGLVIISDPGEVKLKVWDTDYRDNAGSFNVNVIHIPASTIPLPDLVDVRVNP